MNAIPKTCKAGCVVNDGPNFHVVVEDVPVPTSGPDQLLVRLNATGICFSDITYMEGGMGVLLSLLGVRSPGHEGAGVVVQVGASVDGKEWKVGDRVGIKPVWDACMNCDRCWALCLRLGCEHFLDFKEVENVEMEVMKLTGGEGAHAVLVTTGSASAYKSAPSMVRPGGKIMCVGLPKPGQVVAGADPMVMVGKNLSVIGTAVASMLDTKIVLEFAARGLVKPVYEIYPINELPKAVEKLKSGQVAGRLVIDFNS